MKENKSEEKLKLNVTSLEYVKYVKHVKTEEKKGCGWFFDVGRE